MSGIELAIKIDVDTDRGTRLGVPALLDLFQERKLHATFLFSLGPDNTGRAIRRVFRAGFFKKVARTNVVGVYGVRTLLNGVLWPGPHIGQRNEAVMRKTRDLGHDIGIHCYDHIRWQDGLTHMTRDEAFAEFGKARSEFERIFGVPATTAGAAGWQANAFSLAAYDAAGLLFASDARGTRAFFPRIDGVTYRTLQIPTTLPTLDELLGRPEYPTSKLVDTYLSQLRADRPNVLTIHAELEGMQYLALFRELLARLQANGARIVSLRELAQRLLRNAAAIPVCELSNGEMEGRSGTLALQGRDVSIAGTSAS